MTNEFFTLLNQWQQGSLGDRTFEIKVGNYSDPNYVSVYICDNKLGLYKFIKTIEELEGLDIRIEAERRMEIAKKDVEKYQEILDNL